MTDNLTISEVARAAGLSRVSVYKAVNNGELSFSVNAVNGVKTVSKSELARFLSVRGVKSLQSTYSKTEQVLTGEANNALQAQVKSLQALIEAKDAVIEEQRKRLLLLEDLRQQAAPGQAMAVPEPRQNPASERQESTKAAIPPKGIGSRLIGAVWRELIR